MQEPIQGGDVGKVHAQGKVVQADTVVLVGQPGSAPAKVVDNDPILYRMKQQKEDLLTHTPCL